MMNRFYRKLSIRNKLLFIVLVICGVLIGLMATYFIGDKYISYRQAMVENISTLAKVIGINSTAALAFDDPGTAEEILSALSAESDILMAHIFSADGLVFQSYEKKTPEGTPVVAAEEVQTCIGRFANQREVVEIGYHQLDLSHPILLNGATIGHVAIRADMTRINRRLGHFGSWTVFGSILLFFAAQAACVRLQRVITAPLEDVLKTMHLVSSKRDYSQRVAFQSEDELGRLIDSFNDMLAQIQARDRALEEHRENLEELVTQRTMELQNSNDQLKAEINERIQMQEELNRAQKMEAIGLLAAGVAHDLNNILSGITSYPELLLMQIAEDSPLYEPLETIKNSGHRAVAIVQDLLALSRRSVALVDVVDIGQIVSDHLRTPELEHMVTLHPQVNITTRFAPDIMPVAGSKIHLQKTVMNLVNNAIEAMPDGGTITITTDNIYIDTPVKGYETVAEGDYVRLRISDTGTGIEPECIGRIFEPFYTKKVLGRSGTGLGMAIVWGTVKDHNGYIEVNSALGQGTSFSIYLPVTRQTGKIEPESSGENYVGKGESILVVDDAANQRTIAAAILTQLGYKADTVSSGEAAVEYLKTNKADLILLDMVMDPGIGGLETYRRIIEQDPGQRAIIASGYSESDQVKQVQALGAGQYIRKPYAIKKIAAAVREELNR